MWFLLTLLFSVLMGIGFSTIEDYKNIIINTDCSATIPIVQNVIQHQEERSIEIALKIIQKWILDNRLAALELSEISTPKDVLNQLFANHQKELIQHIYGNKEELLAEAVATLALFTLDLSLEEKILNFKNVLLICPYSAVFNFISSAIYATSNDQYFTFHSNGKRSEFVKLYGQLDRAFSNNSNSKDNDHTVLHHSQSAELLLHQLHKIEKFIPRDCASTTDSNLSPTPSPTSSSSYGSFGQRRVSLATTSTSTTSTTLFSCISPNDSTSNTAALKIIGSDMYCPIGEEDKYITNDMWPPSYTSLTQEPTFEQIQQYKQSLELVKVKMQNLLNGDIAHFVRSQKKNAPHQYTNQVHTAYISLVGHCISAETNIKHLEYSYIVNELSQITAGYIEQSKSAFYDLAFATNASNMTEQDLQTLEHKVERISCMLTCSTSHFRRSKELKSDASILSDWLDHVKSVWPIIQNIKNVIQKGVDRLEEIRLATATASLNDANDKMMDYMLELESIFVKVHLTVQTDLQPLTDQINIYSNNKSRIDVYGPGEKITMGLVRNAFDQLDIFKQKMHQTSTQVVRIQDKYSLNTMIEKSKHFLRTLRQQICMFAIMKCMWYNYDNDVFISNGEALQEEYDTYCLQFTEFSLTDYNDICNYFTVKENNCNYQKLGDPNIFDDTGGMHLEEEYTWFEELQIYCDQVNELLGFTAKAIKQNMDIERYIQCVKKVKRQADDNKGNCNEQQALLTSSIEGICKHDYDQIKYPQMSDFEGLNHYFYNYSWYIYQNVSNMKLDTIQYCQTFA